MNIQVNKNHYDFMRYVHINRWCAYYQQINEVVNSGASKVLIIGIGDGIVADMIKNIEPDTIITTVDFDSELNPDICCDICELSNSVEKEYDAIVCCQVLEHLPFDKFLLCLTELKKCMTNRGRLILSLPDSGLPLDIKLHTAHIHIRNIIKICHFWYKDFKFTGEHYWEINSAAKYSAHKIRKDIKKVFSIVDEYVFEYHTYHRFYICERNDGEVIKD